MFDVRQSRENDPLDPWIRELVNQKRERILNNVVNANLTFETGFQFEKFDVDKHEYDRCNNREDEYVCEVSIESELDLVTTQP